MLVIVETETANVEVAMAVATEAVTVAAMEVVEVEVRGVSEDATRIVIGDLPEEETDAETRPEDEPLTD